MENGCGRAHRQEGKEGMLMSLARNVSMAECHGSEAGVVA